MLIDVIDIIVGGYIQEDEKAWSIGPSKTEPGDKLGEGILQGSRSW